MSAEYFIMYKKWGQIVANSFKIPNSHFSTYVQYLITKKRHDMPK